MGINEKNVLLLFPFFVKINKKLYGKRTEHNRERQ